MDPAPQNAAGGDANERDARRHCVVDEGDQEIAFGANGDDNVRVYTPDEFRDNPFYVPSNRSTEEYKHQDSMAHKQVIPDKFAGKISWNDYKPHFDVCRLLNRWDDVEAGRYLATRLQGPALKVLNNIPLGLQLTYTELSAQLERRFGPGGQAENFLLELRSRRRQPRESLQELGQAIRDLVSLAYPELNGTARERLARGHFSDAIDEPEIRAGIFRAHAVTLDDAIQAGLATESFLQAERARERSRPVRHARAVESRPVPVPSPVDENTRKEIEELKVNMKHLTELMENMNTEPKPTTWNDVTCYRCRKQGHISRECPNSPYRNTQQGNENWSSRRATVGPYNKQGPRN